MVQFNTILIDTTFILLHFALFLFNYQVFGKKLFHPATIFSLVWFGIILAHFIFKFTILNELYALNTPTYLVFFVGNICFTTGSLMVSYEELRKEPAVIGASANAAYTPLTLSTNLRLFYLAVIVIGLPFYIQAAYRLFLKSAADDFLVGLRIQLNYGDEDIGPTKYLLSLSAVLYAVNLYAYLNNKTKVNRAIVITCLVVTIVYAVFATGRLFFFMILAIYLGMNYLYKKDFSIKKYARILVVFLAFFMAYGVYLGKGGDKENTVKENAQSSTEALGVYLVSALSALDEQMKTNVEGSRSGDNTLRFFIKIGQQFSPGGGRKEADANRDFVFVPYATNVFTYYNAYIEDFGRIYAWFMLLIFGGLHAWVFNKAEQTKGFRYSFYYSMLLFPLLVSFFSDMYLSILSTWIQVAFFIELILISDKFFRLNKW